MLLTDSRRRTQGGLSIIELMVGVAVGLIVVAGATSMVASQLIENRKLLLETQVQQDLRTTADIIVRELRRAGFSNQWPSEVWNVNAPAGVAGSAPNIYAGVTPTVAPATSVTFDYWDRINPRAGGFRLNGSSIQSRIGGTWQELTDRNTLAVTGFTVTPRTGVASAQLPCPKLCTDGTPDCWPSVNVRELDIQIVAQAVSDAAVTHTVQRTVRLRNDLVNYKVAVDLDPNNNLICPL